MIPGAVPVGAVWPHGVWYENNANFGETADFRVIAAIRGVILYIM